MMTEFEKWQLRYSRHWCTKEQLQRLVQLEVLSSFEYQQITGEELE